MPRQELKCTCTCHDTSRLEKEATESHAFAETQAILDERIASLEADLLTLKKMRNRCSPISWLPTETLTQILLALVQPVGRYKPQSWKTHVELTRVCTHWRSIAMQCPQFWSCIPLLTSKGPAKRVKKILARSMDYPLAIRQRIADDGDEEVYGTSLADHTPTQAALQRTQYLRAQAHRLRRLHLMVDTTAAHLQQYDYLIAQDTPSLESLDVSLVRLHYPNSARSLFSPEFVLSSHRMSSLRTLRLTGFVMRAADWEILSRSPFSTRKLTTLSLGLVVMPGIPGQSPITPPPYDLLLEMLRAFPHLRALKLSSCIGESISDVSESSSNSMADKVHLPRLTSLSLDKTPSTAAVIHFLSDLVFPSNCRIKLHSLRVDRPPDGSSSPSVQSELISRLFLCCGLGGSGYSARAGLRRYEILRLHINDLDSSFTDLRLSNPYVYPGDGRTTNHSLPGDGSISITLIGEKLPKLILEHLPQGILVLDVVHTTLGSTMLGLLGGSSHDPDFPATEDWRNLFAKQPSIQELRLAGKDMGEVLNALGPRPSLSMTPSESEIGQDADVLCNTDRVYPADETLLPRLRSMSFAADVLVDTGNGSPPTLVTKSSNYDSLKTMLIMRRKHRPTDLFHRRLPHAIIRSHSCATRNEGGDLCYKRTRNSCLGILI